jgi:tetratricopeptide (TPR) repeat protein
MLEFKQIPRESIAAALEKALRYRLLNEPLEAESICRDVLRIEPDNQAALVTLLLALTDQFGNEFNVALDEAKHVVPLLDDEYERAYFAGIIYERWGKAEHSRGMPGQMALGWVRAALRCFEKAMALAQPDDPDAILRWNACLRFLEQHQREETSEYEVLIREMVWEYDEEMPPR